MTGLTATTGLADEPRLGRFRPDDIPAARRLWSEHFAPTEPGDDLLELAADPDESRYLGFVARQRASVVGVGLMTIGEGRDLYDVGTEILPEHFAPDAWFLLTAVDPAVRREGVGSDLARARIRTAAVANCDRVIGCAWRHGADLLESLGFEALGVVEDHFDHDPGDVTVYRRWI